MKKGALLIGVIALFVFALPVAETVNSQESVKRLLEMLEKDSDRFKGSLDGALDQSPLDGTSAEDDINRYVQDFEDATDRLKDRYNDRKYAGIQMQEVMSRARTIDTFMRRHKLRSDAETDWLTVKSDLNRLARALNVRARW